MYCVWIGSSILAATSSFEKMCVASEEYNENGAVEKLN